jgi:hypothetical protein
MKKYLIGFFCLLSSGVLLAQTCTISGSGTINWVNGASSPTCVEGGRADDGTKNYIIIPSGVILNFDSNPDTWTGVRIDIQGELRISAAGQVTINSSIEVKNGGFLNVLTKLNMGTTSGCGYNLAINTGGSANIGSGASDRLNICGVEVVRGGGGGCNPFPTGPLPYCEPSGGFTGPVGLDENGSNSTLPVELLYLTAIPTESSIQVSWATASEENFDRFEILRYSGDDEIGSVNNISNYKPIGEVFSKGNGPGGHEYTFFDEIAIGGSNYYALKAIDLDGTFEYFGPARAEFAGEPLIVMPNPATSRSHINFKTNFVPGDNDVVSLVDNMGLMMAREKVNGNVGTLSANFEMKPGVYFLKYTGVVNKVVRVVVR